MRRMSLVASVRKAAWLLWVFVLIAPAGCAAPTTPETKTSPTPVPTSIAEPAPAPPREQVIELPGGVLVDRLGREVRVPAEVAIDVGWLEQIACSRGTREHESLLVVDVPPSEIHAALMLIGLKPGRPGAWIFEESETGTPRVKRIAPKGDSVEVRVAYQDSEGSSHDRPIAAWIIGSDGEETFPSMPWVFGGSTFRTHTSAEGTTETYVADESGSLVGLVTFGDEVLGLDIVISDQIAVDAAEWEVNTAVIPTPGTSVQMILRPWPVAGEDK